MPILTGDQANLASVGVRIGTRYAPLLNFVLLRRIDEEGDLMVGRGIIIPDQAKQQSNKARVVASGPGRPVGERIIPTGVDVGDVVLFSKYGAEEIELDGETYLLIRSDEIKLKEKTVIG